MVRRMGGGEQVERGQDGTTVLINAAAVGGLRDNERLGAVVVEI
jgi:hypothetical protein